MEMQQSRLRVYKKLSKLEKKMASLSSHLATSFEQRELAAHESANKDLNTGGSVTSLELCTAAHEDLRRFSAYSHGDLHVVAHLPEIVSLVLFTCVSIILMILCLRLLHEENCLQREVYQDEEEALRADLSRRFMLASFQIFLILSSIGFRELHLYLRCESDKWLCAGLRERLSGWW